MKKFENSILVTTSLIIIFAVFNAILFAIAKTFSPSFWCGYAFISAATLLNITAFGLVSKHNLNKQTVGLPLRSITVSYLVIACILGILFMILHAAPLVVSLLVQIVPFAFFSIVFIFSLFGKNNYQDETNDEEKFEETAAN